MYSYNGVPYETPDKALLAQEKDIELMLTKITEAKTPFNNTAIVILPSKDYLKRNFIRFSSAIQTSDRKRDKMENYMISAITKQLNLYGEALQRRKLFNRLSITQYNEPEKVIFNEDIAIIFHEGQRFLKKEKNHDVKRLIWKYHHYYYPSIG